MVLSAVSQISQPQIASPAVGEISNLLFNDNFKFTDFKFIFDCSLPLIHNCDKLFLMLLILNDNCKNNIV
jgi:hypothetical protein